MPKLFITHSWRDLSFARTLAQDLSAHGLDGFFDLYTIRPGDNIPSRISSGLESCDIYIPILSTAAFESPWCEWEINTAIQLRNTRGRQGRPRILPVIIDPCHDKIPTILRPAVPIEFWGTPYADSLDRLLAEMGLAIIPAGRPRRDRPAFQARSSKRAPESSWGSERTQWWLIGIGGMILGLIIFAAWFFS